MGSHLVFGTGRWTIISNQTIASSRNYGSFEGQLVQLNRVPGNEGATSGAGLGTTWWVVAVPKKDHKAAHQIQRGSREIAMKSRSSVGTSTPTPFLLWASEGSRGGGLRTSVVPMVLMEPSNSIVWMCLIKETTKDCHRGHSQDPRLLVRLTSLSPPCGNPCSIQPKIKEVVPLLQDSASLCN